MALHIKFKNGRRAMKAAAMLAGFVCALGTPRGANADWTVTYLKYQTAEGKSVGLVTDNPGQDLITALGAKYKLTDKIEKSSATAVGTTYMDAAGHSHLVSAPEANAKLNDAQGPAADDCATSPGVTINPAALPFDGTYSTNLTADNGDFRGSAGDTISTTGGRDAFWKFTPSQTGIYSVTVTAGSSAGIGVWQGTCGALTEVGTAFNLFGGGTSNLSVKLTAGQLYYIVWEDHFPGSLEDSVRLRVSLPVLPAGETAPTAINLAGYNWSLGFSVAAANDANTNTLHFPDPACKPDLSATGGGHGSSDAGDGSDVWFRLPATRTGDHYVLDSSEGTMTNSVFVLYSHPATSAVTTDLVAEACNDDKNNTGNHGANDFMSKIEFTGDANKAYFLFVESYSLGGPGNGTFTLTGQGPAASETTLIENFNMGGGFAANFVDTDAANDETPQYTSATLPAKRFDRGLDSGRWGGLSTTGSLYMYNFNGSTYRTDPSVPTGYMLKDANSGNETGSYFYTFFPHSRIDISYTSATLEWVSRYGGAASTTASLRLIVRSNYDTGHGPRGLWLISDPFTISGLTGVFSTNPVQNRGNFRAMTWHTVDAPSATNLTAVAAGDEAPITIGAVLPHGIDQLLSEVDGFGFYINADIIPSGSAASGLFFDSIALTGVLTPQQANAAKRWASYE